MNVYGSGDILGKSGVKAILKETDSLTVNKITSRCRSSEGMPRIDSRIAMASNVVYLQPNACSEESLTFMRQPIGHVRYPVAETDF